MVNLALAAAPLAQPKEQGIYNNLLKKLANMS